MDTLQTKIIKKYIKISGFFFHYLIFLVALVIGLFIFQRVISQSATIHMFEANDLLLVQKTKLVAEFTKFLKQDIQDNNIQIKVLQ
ncbi:MAG: hypothetical protein WCL02_01480 [bacterium]